MKKKEEKSAFAVKFYIVILGLYMKEEDIEKEINEILLAIENG